MIRVRYKRGRHKREKNGRVRLARQVYGFRLLYNDRDDSKGGHSHTTQAGPTVTPKDATFNGDEIHIPVEAYNIAVQGVC
jgi:hypothetical protein